MEGRREIKMAAPASGVDPPTRPPRGNKRKKGRKLRSRAEGGRSACRGAARTWRRTRGPGKEGDEDGDGYPRGKQFLLIQRSHPHRGASLVDPLLDLSPSLARSLFHPFSPGLPSRSSLLCLSLSLAISPHRVSLCAREPGFCEQVLLRSRHSHPSYSFLSLLSRPAEDPSHRQGYGSLEIRCTLRIDRRSRRRFLSSPPPRSRIAHTLVAQLTRFPTSPGLSSPGGEYPLCEISLFARILVSPFTMAAPACSR